MAHRITALHANRDRGRKVKVYVDGKPAFIVPEDVAASEGLQVGQILSDEQVDMLAKRDKYERCLDAAEGYLAYRPRSDRELRSRLSRRGFDKETQETVIGDLRGRGLLNDLAFANFWTDNRESFSPRSRLMTRIELEQKGVARDVIDEAVNSIDDEASAYRAALARLHSLREADYEVFCRRLGAYLTRRGFGRDVVVKTVKQAWKDLQLERSGAESG